MLSKLDQTIFEFKKFDDLNISNIMDTGDVEIKGDSFSTEEMQSLINRIAIQGGISPGRVSWYMTLATIELYMTLGPIEFSKKGFRVIGFSTCLTGECHGSEPFNLPFANDLGHENNTWKAQAFTKTEWAKNFIKAHTTVCNAIKILRDLGFKVKVSDEGGFWGKEDMNNLKETKKQSDAAMSLVAETFKNKGFSIFSPLDDKNQTP